MLKETSCDLQVDVLWPMLLNGVLQAPPGAASFSLPSRNAVELAIATLWRP